MESTTVIASHHHFGIKPWLFSLAMMSLASMPAAAFECQNSGAAGSSNDHNDATRTACGANADAANFAATAVGIGVTAAGNYSTAIGASAATNANDAVAVGGEASATGVGSTAVGTDSTAGAIGATALGQNASASGSVSTALGYDTSAAGTWSTAVGRAASTPGEYSIALGYLAQSAGEYGAALGRGATASNTNATALGRDAFALAAQTTALGGYAQANAIFATALGYRSAATGYSSTAVGDFAYTDQAYTIVLGSIDGVNGAGFNTDVAIGTTAPLAPLHIFRDDGTAQVLVEESDAVQGPRTLFEIANNGNPEFRMTNTGNNNSWTFSAGLRFVVKNNLGDWVMRVTDIGNLEIGGTLLEMSDRNRKHAIVPLDGETVLAKLVSVPVSEWAYNDESADQRHIGPMAQDFYAAFGLASGETRISARDMAGVNMAAIQALAASNARLVNENRELRDRVLQLEAGENNLSALEVRLEAIERQLPKQAAVVVQAGGTVNE